MDLRKLNKQKIITGAVALLAIIGLVLLAWLIGRSVPAPGTPGGSVVTLPGAPSTAKTYQITQEQTAGPKSGYKIDISFDQLPINPYPGSISQGHIRILNAQGKLATEASGGVWLYEEALENTHYGTRMLVGSTVVTGNEYGSGLQGRTSGSWLLREDGSNIYDFNPVQPLTNDALQSYPCAEDQQAAAWLKANSVSSGQYVMLINGQGDFSYINRGLDNPIKLTAKAIEEPIYPVAAPQYKFTWGYESSPSNSQSLIDNSTSSGISSFFGGFGIGTPTKRTLISNEPANVKAARLAKLKGYQIIGQVAGTGGEGSPVRMGPPAVDIITTTTIPIGEFSAFDKPQPPQEQLTYVSYNYRTDKLDYHYDITFNPKQINGQMGSKFTLTIQPEANPGKTLPYTIHDQISLYLEEGYTLDASAAGTTSLKDGWLKRNYLAYFTGVNGQPLRKSGSGYAPASDTPYGYAEKKELGGPVDLRLDSIGDTITVELAQTGNRSVMGFLAVRLTSNQSQPNIYDQCSRGVDEIASAPFS
jgi:hypothetical protein